MASAFTHAIAGLAIGTAFRPRYTSARYWISGAVIAALPDVDGIGFWLGIPYESTFGHRGIAFFAPFANGRYFFPWRPILVSPMSIRRFFSERGARIIASEIVWVWIPAGVLAFTSLSFRVKRGILDVPIESPLGEDCKDSSLRSE